MSASTPRTNEDWLDIEAVRVRLKSRSVQGGTMALLSQGSKVAIQMGTMIVLSRLLSPADFGFVAMGTIIVELIRMIRDGGLGTALLQKSKINQQEASNVFWIGILGSAGFSLGTIALGPVVAFGFDEPGLVGLLAAMALPVFVGGLGAQQQTLLRRRMHFGAIALVDFVSDLAGALVAIGVAWAGYGYVALVARQWAQSVFQSAGFWIACSWRPSFYDKATSVREIVRFGGAIGAARILNYVARNGDTALVGRFLGPEILGFYVQAFNLFRLPIQRIRGPLQNVTQPGLNTLREDPEKMIRYYLRFVELLALVTMPPMVFGTAFATDTVRILLGPKWIPAGELFAAFALVGVLAPVLGTRSQYILACDLRGRYLRWQIYSAFQNVAAAAVGIPFGVRGVVYAYVIANYAALPIAMPLFFRDTPLETSRFLRTLVLPLVGSLVGLGVALALRHSLPREDKWLFLALFAGTLATLGTWACSPGLRARLRTTFDKKAFESPGAARKNADVAAQPADGSSKD